MRDQRLPYRTLSVPAKACTAALSGAGTGAALADIYASDKDPAIRRAVIQALFIQNNAESLVAMARKEQDPAMKKEIVQKLSVMNSKVATDYLLELLNK